MQLPQTNRRVSENTSPSVNAKIQQEIAKSVQFYRVNPQLISERLDELDNEWDIERVLETNASSLIVASSLLGVVASRKFFAVPFVVGAFLLQHALQGWCPPLPIYVDWVIAQRMKFSRSVAH
ncbi:hypothetical protein GCM10011613_24790 [Cellvibrio zantedeschiae]|uniref:DUF2892 domain-containing protein n=1 Tax=Cellvibrio zantedeschiae TaxID=1237077 RepID=A0ABQ3B4A5_9GAMM|nr:DUF2892 domain-containing protein [Cellvibrio zantedeschiae]GGY79047.1 hypothetical protein GCM10011613_24790 [Cellvibrio zantedeschiae]